MWTQKTLKDTIRSKLSEYKLIIVSNRQPFHHVLKGNKVTCQREPGGLVTALHPVMQAAQGTWIAAGSSEQDRKVLDQNQRVMVPPDSESPYILKRLFLSKEDRDGYYYGYSNEGLWPLCHIAYTRPFFTDTDWKTYQTVNRQFTEAVLAEAGKQKAFVWIQDFHLTLVPKYLREAGASNIITAIFWHVPWPNPEVFRICPQKIEILEGLMACDLIGFQIRYHADNFLAAIDREIESRIDRERNSVIYQNHESLVRPFPISVDFDDISSRSSKSENHGLYEQIQNDFSLTAKRLLVGVDRIDYTKGLPEKLRAFDRFLDKYPEYKENVVLFQLGQISRLHIQRYKDLNDEINALVEEINWKHSQGSWQPIVLTRAHFTYDQILALYRAADACLVSSLHDGMNLVAKEFVASRSDLRGSLILSRFTGSARELTDSCLINPFDIEQFADTIQQALTMTETEQERRMIKMRETVAQNNIYRWAGKVLSQLLKFEFQEA